jgi:NAD(P)-dependent dehydrogenase (short-subunit alcohol dehydrogenase family)
MDQLEGRVAVITGGSSGIGRGIALACLEAGMRVYVTGRTPGHLRETVQDFATRGFDVHSLQVDVTDLPAMLEAARRVEEETGGIDLLVNNAGIGLTGPVNAATPADWDWLIDVNIKGVGHGLQAFLPLLRRERPGRTGAHIVNTSSMAGLMPIVAGLYSMTKAAVIALSEALHIELAPEGIGVSAYCPGPTHSNIAAAVANRPEGYGASGYDQPDPRHLEAAAHQPYMSAEEAGQRVLAGVRRGDLFILTHPEFRAGVVERHRTIEDAFPDEPADAERAAAIPFLTSSPVYGQDHRLPPPVHPGQAVDVTS